MFKQRTLVQSILLITMLAGITGCDPGYNPPSHIDETRAEIMAADMALSQAVAERNLEAFSRMIAEKTAFHGSSGIMTTREEVVKAWSVFFDPSSGLTLSWTPTDTDVSACRDMGYSRGEYTLVSKKEDSPPATEKGYYVTVWQRDTEGKWQAIVDIGCPKEAR